MDKQKIIITVAGAINTGKSHVLLEILEMLQARRFDIKFDGGIDYKDVHTFMDQTAPFHDKAMDVIKDRVTVELREVQLSGKYIKT